MISEGFGLVVAAVIGSILGPTIQHFILTWSSDRPRKKLLKEILKNSNNRFKGLDYLSRVIGANEDETRRLLISIGARGAKLKKSGKEGWALIARAPLSESLDKIESTEGTD